MPAFDSYIICTSPRSGSTLLCRLLQEAGVAGHPESWFHGPSVEAWREGLSLSPASNSDEVLRHTMAAAIDQGRGTSTLFALRLQRHSFDFLIDRLGYLAPDAATDAERLSAAFGRIRFILLSRPDTLAQAVSYVRASQTGLWHRNADGTELERLAPPKDPAYDRAAIAKELAELKAQDDAWRDWFAHEGITPLTLTYDELAENPIRVLAQVLDDLGLDPDAARDVVAPTARLSDRINRDWVARFRVDTKIR